MDWQTFGITTAAIILILGVVLGCGSNRRIVVFHDYDDLGLTFMVPASFVLIVYLFGMFGADQRVATIVGGVVASGIFMRVAWTTFLANGNNIFRTLLALVTKVPVSIIWILNLLQLLNPSGKGAERSRNRGQALIILTLMTPILGLLVVNRSGSFFNPRQWLHGRRIGGGIRDHL